MIQPHNLLYQCLVASVLDEVMATKPPGDGLRVWTMPLAGGVEPYLLTIFILEHWPRAQAVAFNVVASDRDPQALARAGEGWFQENELAFLSTDMRQRHFQQERDGWRASKALREGLHLTGVELTDPVATKAFRGMDVIFCQQMLPALATPLRRRAAGHLFDALNPGGFLFLHPAESMAQSSALFRVRHFPEGLAYQKPGPCCP